MLGLLSGANDRGDIEGGVRAARDMGVGQIGAGVT